MISTGPPQYKPVNDSSAHMSPSGYALTVPYNALTIGVNVFMEDCIITGTAFPSSTLLP